MRLLLQDPVFISLVTYLQGSTLNDSDLERAKAESCIAIFLLTNKFTENADNEDSKAILQHLAISNYIKKCNEMKIARNFPPSPSPMFCVQMVLHFIIRMGMFVNLFCVLGSASKYPLATYKSSTPQDQ